MGRGPSESGRRCVRNFFLESLELGKVEGGRDVELSNGGEIQHRTEVKGSRHVEGLKERLVVEAALYDVHRICP